MEEEVEEEREGKEKKEEEEEKEVEMLPWEKRDGRGKVARNFALESGARRGYIRERG